MSGILDYLTLEDDYFDAAQALYWYCADYHEGQWSRKYEILSTLGYNPSPLESGPTLDNSSALIYEELQDGTLTVEDVLEFVNEGYAIAHAEEG